MQSLLSRGGIYTSQYNDGADEGTSKGKNKGDGFSWILGGIVHSKDSKVRAMALTTEKTHKLTFHPLELKRWKDFEELFGARGACGGCWCMSWRLARSDFERQKGKGNKNAMKKLVKQNEQIGILAYSNGKPIGWCAIAPREQYIKL